MENKQQGERLNRQQGERLKMVSMATLKKMV